MWLFLWFIFVVAILCAFAWSFHVVFEQKRAWKAFADKYNLIFTKGSLLKPPSATGMIKGRNVYIYVQETMINQGQTRQSASIVEVYLNAIPDTFAVVTSTGFADYQAQLQLPEPFAVNDPEWPQIMLSRTYQDIRPDVWFAADNNRIKAIQKLSALPFDTAFVADGNQAFIAVRTVDPLIDPRKINNVMAKLFEIAPMLESNHIQNQIVTAPPVVETENTTMENQPELPL